MINKISRVLLLTIFLVGTLSTSVYAWKKPYKRGLNYLKNQAYEQAIDQFEEALASDKIKQRHVAKVERKLKEAKILAAQDLFRRGERLLDEKKIKDAVSKFKKAKEYVPDNQQYVRRYAEAKDILDKMEDELNRGVADALNNRQWDKAVQKLKSYEIYEASFPDIPDRIRAVNQQAVDFYVNLSDQKLSFGNYQGAYADIEQALKYSSDQTILDKKNARHHLLMSQVAWKKRNYMKAYEDIRKGLEFEPGHPELNKYQQLFLEEWAGILYNKAVQANNNGEYAAALASLTQLSRLKPGFLNTEELLSEIQETMTSAYYDKAEAIMNSEDPSHVGLALAYYLLVREQHNHPYFNIDDKIAEAKRRFRRQLEFRISMDFNNRSQEPGAGELVKGQMLSKLKKAKGLRNLTILDREDIDHILHEQGLGQGFLDESTALQVKKIKGLQAAVKGDVIKISVKELGRERPSYGNSRYVAGKRWVPNPSYQQAMADVTAAQQNVLQAQRNYNNSQAQQQQIMQNQARLKQSAGNTQMGAMVGVLSQLSGDLGKAQVDRAMQQLGAAQTRLARTPQQIEENIESDYRYEIFDLKLVGEVVLSFKMINYTTSEIGQVRTIKKMDSVSDRYIPGDPGKGVRTDPLELPPMDEFKNRLLSQAIEELAAAMAKELAANSQSYWVLAQKAQRDQLEEEAIEQCMRYIYAAPDLNDSRVQEANEYIYEKLGLSVIRRKR